MISHNPKTHDIPAFHPLPERVSQYSALSVHQISLYPGLRRPGFLRSNEKRKISFPRTFGPFSPFKSTTKWEFSTSSRRIHSPEGKQLPRLFPAVFEPESGVSWLLPHLLCQEL